jgi:hypothetical protein
VHRIEAAGSRYQADHLLHSFSAVKSWRIGPCCRQNLFQFSSWQYKYYERVVVKRTGAGVEAAGNSCLGLCSIIAG